jgi:hypothetical protein
LDGWGSYPTSVNYSGSLLIKNDPDIARMVIKLMKSLVERGRSVRDAINSVEAATGVSDEAIKGLWRRYVAMRPVALKRPLRARHCWYCGLRLRKDTPTGYVYDYRQEPIEVHSLCISLSQLYCNVGPI